MLPATTMQSPQNRKGGDEHRWWRSVGRFVIGHDVGQRAGIGEKTAYQYGATCIQRLNGNVFLRRNPCLFNS